MTHAPVTWHSQAGQEEWVHSIVGGGGYFVDIGAHNGLVHSNTYALEQFADWTGHCVEPNEEAFEHLIKNRNCSATCVAISDHKGLVPFDGVRVGAGSDVECWTLVDLLKIGPAPYVIDYLSIDVEGHELEVLAGMDFDRWKVRLITIEHNLYCDGPARKDAIHEVLNLHGFARVVEDVVAPGYGPYEDWYMAT